MQATPGLPKPSDTSRSTGRMCHDRPPNIVFDVTGGPVGGTRREVPFCARERLNHSVISGARSGPERICSRHLCGEGPFY
jgi:hypothetical protein